MVLAWVTVTIFFVYTVVMVWHAVGYIRHKFHQVVAPVDVPVTIIIPARNEEKYIARCLNSILSQHYPPHLVEIILVNDAGNDQTVVIANHLLSKSPFAFKIISNAQHEGKKRSLQKAINMAKHDFIITRDADTFTTSNHWLNSICSCRKNENANFIIAPVMIADNFGLLWALQAIEMQLLQLFTVGAAYFKKPYLCNGANLGFSKQLFQSVNGYELHLEVSSGDDVLLLESIKSLPYASISYLKHPNAIVQTFPAYSFQALVSQKVRWAGKYKKNPNAFNALVGAVLFAGNLTWLLNLFVGFVNPLYGQFGLIFIIFKLVIDILLLFLAGFFIRNKHIVMFALPIGFIYPLYVVIIAVSTLFVKPKWK
jgi:poly-beta-1,6-N-acetyl-D-glucosamine synthase